MDDGLDRIDAGMAQERLDRPAQDRLTGQGPVLLGDSSRGAFTPAGGDDKGDSIGHGSSGSQAMRQVAVRQDDLPTCAVQHFAYTIGNRTDCLIYRHTNAWGRPMVKRKLANERIARFSEPDRFAGGTIAASLPLPLV